jgi:hypothetical protein
MAIDKNNPVLTSSEKASLKKQKHIENLAKSNPQRAASNKQKNDNKRERRAESGSKNRSNETIHYW